MRGGNRPAPAEVEAPPEPGSDLALVVDSPLFDDAWYAAQTGVARTRIEAARHYLDGEDSPQPPPHPLFDADYFVARLPVSLVEELADGDPFVFYLRKRLRASHQPDVRRCWVRGAEPRVARAPGGPLAHYDQVGAIEGLQANDWMPVGSDGTYPDLRQWLHGRHTRAVERGRLGVGRRRRYDHDGERAFLQEWATVEASAVEGRPMVSVVLEVGLDRGAAGRVAPDRGRPDHAGVGRRRHRPGWCGRPRPAARRASRPERHTIVAASDETLAQSAAEALTRASGKYVAFLRAGDTWTPDRLRS